MDVTQTRSALRVAAGVSLTALLTTGILYLLLSRLGDAAGASWAGWTNLLAAVATMTAVTLLSLTDGGGRPSEPADR